MGLGWGRPRRWEGTGQMKTVWVTLSGGPAAALHHAIPADIFPKKKYSCRLIFYLRELSQSRHLSLHSSYNILAHCMIIYLFTCLSSLELFEGKNHFLCDLISQSPAKNLNKYLMNECIKIIRIIEQATQLVWLSPFSLFYSTWATSLNPSTTFNERDR